MKRVLRSLLLWLLLLAIPFQGVASASMLLCGTAQKAAPALAMEAGHDHAAMMAAASHGAEHSAASGASHDGSEDSGHGSDCGAKCGTPGACCVGAALAPSISASVPALESPSHAIPFHAARLQAVDLAHPLRPPQAIPA